jgi:hypothetical protein
MSIEVRHELLQKDFEILAKKYEILSSNYDNLSTEHEQYNQHIYKLIEENEILKADLNRSKVLIEENAELKQTLNRYKSSVIEVKDSSIKSLKDSRKVMEIQIHLLEQSEMKLKSQIAGLNNKLKGSIEFNNKSSLKIEEKEKEVELLLQKYKKAKRHIECKDQRIYRLEAQIKMYK